MLKTIKNILSGILEGIVAAKQYNANRQLNKTMDHVDLKTREEELKFKEKQL